MRWKWSLPAAGKRCSVAEQAVLSLGSNLGERESHLRQAVQFITREDGIGLLAASSLYLSSALEVPAPQEEYLNQIVVVSTRLSAPALLEHCQAIEVDLGRPRDHLPGSPRTIDIDLITYGSLICSGEGLVLPHPRYTRRKFVLLPLAEVWPTFRDPRTGHTVQELLENCPDTSIIHRCESLQGALC